MTAEYAEQILDNATEYTDPALRVQLGIGYALVAIAKALESPQPTETTIDVMRSIANHFDNVGMGGASNEVRLLMRTAEKSRERYLNGGAA